MLEQTQKSREESAFPPPRPIIPTEYRREVWKSTGYPLDAELISQALHDVPQYDYLKLCFWEFDDWS